MPLGDALAFHDDALHFLLLVEAAPGRNSGHFFPATSPTKRDWRSKYPPTVLSPSSAVAIKGRRLNSPRVAESFEGGGGRAGAGASRRMGAEAEGESRVESYNPTPSSNPSGTPAPYGTRTHPDSANSSGYTSPPWAR